MTGADSKLNQVADNVTRIYKATAAERGTQVIFMDMAKSERSDGTTFNSVTELKRKLKDRGINAKEIVSVGDVDKDELLGVYRKLKTGEYRVAIASTMSMGTGANIQDRLAALHHVDVPWRWSDIEQREGRILRPGNQYYKLDKPVEIMRYIAQGSYDQFMWQLVEAKAKIMNQAMARKFRGMVVEIDETTNLSAAQARALAMGRTEVLELAKLDGGPNRDGTVAHLSSLRSTRPGKQGRTLVAREDRTIQAPHRGR